MGDTVLGGKVDAQGNDSAAEEQIQFIGVRIGEEDYLIEIGCVKEINMVSNITHVPRVEEYFEGVINLRGNIIPVINLGMRLGKGRSEFSQDTRIVITDVSDIMTGFIVDEVSNVVLAPKSIIERGSGMHNGINGDFVHSYVKYNGKIMTWLNLEKILERNE